MNTPIYEELVEQFQGLTEGVQSAIPGDRLSEDDDHGPGGGPHAEETVIIAAEPTTACYWCGTPLWTDSECHEWLDTDPAGGESVPVTACSAEHLARLRAARGVNPEPEPWTEAGANAVSGATTPMALSAPSAPTPAPPSLTGATEPVPLPPYGIATPVEVDDDELAAEPIGESALFGPLSGPDHTGARTDVGHRVGH